MRGERTGDDGRRTTVCSVLALVSLVFLLGCEAGADPAARNSAAAPAPSATAQPSAPASASAFDGARALEHVRKQVAFGPRPAGSPALAECRKYIVGELKSYGLAVREQPFVAATPLGKVNMVNVIAELPGASPDTLVVGSHYDTKRTPAGFLGANDAGSSTGALLEIARVLSDAAKQRKPDFTIQFVFFDGEEAVVQWTDEDSVYGSTHFVDALDAAHRVRGMVLLDMIGDRDLVLRRDETSTRSLVDVVWQTAAAVGHGKHFSKATTSVSDDHSPFLDAGIPAVDLIDFEYGSHQTKFGEGGPTNAYWHTTEDTMDKISADSLKVIGDVVIAALPKVMAVVK
jgi:glutaminyl-peptide cyclotransferase